MWSRTAIIPFSWAGSKNYIFRSEAAGHTALREEKNRYKAELVQELKASLEGQRIAANKLWIDLIVEKPNHRGDAANFVDMICDAVKEASSLDDRWFSIRRLDWRIAKQNPRLIIRVGQQSVQDLQACSSCGRLLPLMNFHSNKGIKSGVTRNCRDCSAARLRYRGKNRELV